jgi:hypothetical protein
MDFENEGHKRDYVDAEAIAEAVGRPKTDHAISLLFPTRLDAAGSNYIMLPQFVYPTPQHLIEGRKLRLAFDPSVESEHVPEYMKVLATKVPLDLNGSGIEEAINKPRHAGDTAASTALAKVLAKMKRENVAFGVVSYELYRSSTPQR